MVRFLCPLAGVPGAAVVRRSFYWGMRLMRHSCTANKSSDLNSEPLPPLPISEVLLKKVVDAMQLSPQHARVVELVLRGLCDKQISEIMGIHKSTLRTYFDRIAARTGAMGRIAIFQKVLAVSHQIAG